MPSLHSTDRTPFELSGRPGDSRLSPARSAAADRAAIPMGSLTQRLSGGLPVCAGCGSARLTEIALSLTDGTEVDFTSCHLCAQTSWISDGVELDLADVLDHTRKVS